MNAAHDLVRGALGSPLVPEDVRERALSRLENLPEGDLLGHFDFHPPIVLRAGDEYTMIDWPNAARADPEADVASTTMILMAASAPEHTPFVVRRLDLRDAGSCCRSICARTAANNRSPDGGGQSSGISRPNSSKVIASARGRRDDQCPSR